jgi:hypothetical protein
MSRSLPPASRFDEAGLVREDDGLDAVAQVELAEDARHVRFHGRRADDELGRDLRVREAAGDEPEHLDLALAPFLTRTSVADWVVQIGAGLVSAVGLAAAVAAIAGRRGSPEPQPL